MAHVSVGPILGTTKWRVERGTSSHDRDTEAEALHLASALAGGGGRIVAGLFHDPVDTTAPMEEFLEITANERVADLTISELKTELETGDYDAILDEIEAAEREGQNRSGALKAITARREEISE